MFKHFFKSILLSVLFIGCQVIPREVPQGQVDKLAILFQLLDKRVSQKESLKLSQDIFQKTKKLTEEFKLTSPPLWHNFLVNVGIRKKGLCYHWSDALYLHLKKGHYKDFSFHLVGANIGSYFKEHNALVVTTKRGKIQEGIVIDPWRNSGNLYFSKLKEDQAYVWKHRPDRRCE